MIITNNLLSSNAALNLGLVKDSRSKSFEKLSSGYRVNRASDDAAGLSISEKMRSQVRGLMRAAQNTQDGISLIETTDGATDQVANILQRMRELSIQALNTAVNTVDDRAKIQLEFDQLQSEMDRINDQTEFNQKPVFNHYEKDHYVTKGNINWIQDQIHSIDNYNNSMTIKYKTEPDVDESGAPIVSPEKEVTIKVPNGTYTTQQLVDEIDDVVTKLGLDPEKISLEYSDRGTCNLVLENAAQITDMSGGLTYLFHDEYAGSEVGSLIGTTIFEPGTKGLQIYDGHNDYMEFTIQYMNGTPSKHMSIDIPTSPKSFYTREEMIDFLNTKLAGTGVSALEYGDKSIMLGSDKAIVTGLRGNMFEIDDPSVPGTIVATSVFYDNTKYGRTTVEPAVFNGGAVVSTSGKITIGDDNNLLRIRVNDKTGEYKDVRLQNGSYYPGNMINELNRAFNAAGVPVKAAPLDDQTTLRMTNGNTIYLTGFKLTTNDKGKDTSIEFDTTSKAYQTLFTDRSYLNQGKEISEQSTNYNLYKYSFIGGKDFNDASNLPLVINNSNNSMTLKLYETPISGTSSQKNYTINIANGTYDTKESILAAFSQGLSSAGLGEKVTASFTAAGKLQLQPSMTDKTVGSKNQSMTISIPSSAAYRSLFIGSEDVPNENESVPSNSSTTPELIISERTMPDNPKGLRYRFNIGGETRYVDFPEASYDKASFIARLNSELAGSPDTTTSRSSGVGTTAGSTKNVSVSNSVTTEPENPPISASARGEGYTQQGTTDQSEMKPAVYTVNTPVKVPMTLNSTNNSINIRVNEHSYHISLSEKTYTTAQEIADEIQTKMNSGIANDADKMKVTLDGSGKLRFESVQPGQNVSFSFRSEQGSGSMTASSFFHEMTAVKNPASVTVSRTVQNNINMPAGATFNLVVNGENKSVTWDSPASYTSRSTFLSDLNSKLTGIGVTAGFTGSNYLAFTTLSKGKNSSISVKTADSPAFSEAIYGAAIKDTPATLTFSRVLKSDDDTIAMKAGENTIRLTDGSNTYTYTFDVGTEYTRQGIVDKLNQQNTGFATASIDSNGKLVFTTKKTGNSARIQLYPSTSTSLASAGLFGQTVQHHPGVTASITDDNHLKLTGDTSDTPYVIRMYRKENSDILPANNTTRDISPENQLAGTVGVGVYQASSQNTLREPVVISSENNTLSFTSYGIDGVARNHSLSIPDGSYTIAGLESALQTAVNSKLGAGKMTIFHNGLNGLTFNSKPDYSIYDISNWGGSFYQKILRGDLEVNKKVPVSEKDGSQLVGDTYIVGRKDVRNQTTVIQPGVNDTFSLMLYVNNSPYRFSFTLDPGSYDSGQLVDMLNNKLSDAAEGNGLPREIVKAAVGRYNTGVVGSNDANALDFYLNPDVNLSTGTYKIEGLEGNSLFDIFYKTVGNLIAAYTTGTKDLSDGVDIPEGKQDFSITVDDTVYNFTIDPAGHYTAEEFIDKINEMIRSAAPTPPIKASLSRGAIQFSHDNIGKHKVTSLRGPAVQEFFYENDSSYGESDEQWLQVGANAMQGITFSRYSVSSHALGVNTVNLTEKKYADKALTRIDVAMSNLMSSRSRFGALQNRLEFTQANDINAAINLQDSESRIRDTDMAEEMMQLAKKNILEQAGMSMLTQAIRQPEAVLSLLR